MAKPLVVDHGYTHMVLGITWTLTAVCILTVAARFWVRARVVRAVASDDWVMLLAVALMIVFAVVETKFLQGLLNADPVLGFFSPEVLKWAVFSVIPATLVSIVARVSGAIFLIRIFGTKLWLKWYLIVLTVLQVVLGVLAIVFYTARANPVEANWDPSKLKNYRWGPEVGTQMAIVVAVLFAWSDLTYVMFPAAIIWKLNMPRRRRLGLIILMAMSLFTMVACIVKALSTLGTGNLPNPFKPADGLLWAGIEQSFVIMIGCIPPLMPVAKLDHPFINYLNSLISRLVSRKSSHGSTPAAPPGSGFRGNAGYQDMEMRGAGSAKDEVALTVIADANYRGKSSHSDAETGSATTEFERQHNGTEADHFQAAYTRSHENVHHPKESI